jgi:hypothetical protein
VKGGGGTVPAWLEVSDDEAGFAAEGGTDFALGWFVGAGRE